MSNSKISKRLSPRTWLPPEPPPPPGPDAVIVPESQISEVVPQGLLEALEEGGPSIALDPKWKAARDAFLASMDEEWGPLILQILGKLLADRKDCAQESARDLRQKVLLVALREFDEHFAETGEAWKPPKPGAYFRDVAQKVAKEHFRAKGRRPAIAWGVEVGEAADLGPDPEEAARHRQLLEIFEREPGILTAAEAEVFEGRVSNEMTFPMIAAVVRRNVTTVYAQYRRALEKLSAIAERVR